MTKEAQKAESPELLVRKVIDELLVKNFDGAAKLAIDEVNANPESAVAHYCLGKALEGFNFPADAILSYGTALSLNSKYKEAADALILLLSKTTDIDKAQRPPVSILTHSVRKLKYYSQSIPVCIRQLEENGYDEDVYFQLAEAFDRLNDNEAAAQCYHNIINKNQSALEGYARLGFIFYKLSQYDHAKEYFTHLINNGFTDPKFNLLHALTLNDNPKVDEAFKEFSKTYPSRLHLTSSHIYMLAYCCLGFNFSKNLMLRAVKQEEEFDTIVDHFSFFVDYIILLYPELYEVFEEYFYIKPNRLDSPFYLIGSSALRSGNSSLASKAYNKILKHFPESDIAESGLASANLEQGEIEQFAAHREQSVINKLNDAMSLRDARHAYGLKDNTHYPELFNRILNKGTIQEIIINLHESSNVKHYLEIAPGSQHLLFKLAKPETRKTAVIPDQLLSPPANSRIFTINVNAFFSKKPCLDYISSEAIDLVVMNHMHNNLQDTLKFFINIIPYLSENSTVCICNTYPIDGFCSIADRRTGYWVGDTWKAILAISKYCPEVKIKTHMASPGGISVIEHADKADPEILLRQYPEIINEFEKLSFADIYKSLDELLHVSPEATTSVHT